MFLKCFHFFLCCMCCANCDNGITCMCSPGVMPSLSLNMWRSFILSEWIIGLKEEDAGKEDFCWWQRNNFCWQRRHGSGGLYSLQIWFYQIGSCGGSHAGSQLRKWSTWSSGWAAEVTCCQVPEIRVVCSFWISYKLFSFFKKCV